MELIPYFRICIWQQKHSERDEKISRVLDLYEFLTNIVWQRGQVLNSVLRDWANTKYAENLLFSREKHAASHVILGILLRGLQGGKHRSLPSSRHGENYLREPGTRSLRESLVKHSSLIKPECDLGP